MKMSSLFSQTMREASSDAESSSHQLLLRAGFIRQLAPGLFSYLPLAQRSLGKIDNIIRDELNTIGGQEFSLPVVCPAYFSQESGRWNKFGSKGVIFRDSKDHPMVAAANHAEIIANLVRNEIRSYRQLPQLLYQTQKIWRDDPRPHAGLIKAREFTQIDSYSLDADWEGAEKQHEAVFQAYQNTFKRVKLPVTMARSNTSVTGSSVARAFMYHTTAGEDTVLICDNCGYNADIHSARVSKHQIGSEPELAIEKVATPGAKTIGELSMYLSIPTYKTAKAVFMVATLLKGNEKFQQFVFVIVRGDMEVNETKLINSLNALELRPATDDEIRAIGAVPGYASPVGLKDLLIVVDEIIPHSSNLVSGANIEGYHLRNVNYGRDYKADIVADITLARDGDECPDCEHPLRSVRSIEIGRTRLIGTQLSEAVGCQYLDPQGQYQPVVIGVHAIEPGRLLACIAEEHHDVHGLIWPITVSPYQIHLVSLPWKTAVHANNDSGLAEQLYQILIHNNFDCLYDDREESPGVKFNDADLIGNPIRLTISERSLKNGGVEYKRRDKPEKTIIPYESIIPALKEEIRNLASTDP